MALGRLCGVAAELAGDPLQILLGIAVKKRISALVGIMGLLLFCIPALQGFDILPGVVLPGRGVAVHTESFL